MSDFLKSLYDIRVKPDGQRRRAGERACDWPNCQNVGEHRAPKSPTRLHEHHWFCLEHVRAYNAKWNFFQGMSMAEIDAYQSTTSTWHRPTWTVGANPQARRRASAGPSMGKNFDPRFVDPMGVLDDGPLAARLRTNRRADPPRTARPDPGGAIRASLAALDLDDAVSLKEIKARYKQLVKRYHPDANGGDNGAEDRLKRVIQAYRHLVTSGYFR